MTGESAMPAGGKLVLTLAVLITLLGLTLRLHKLSNQSLWTDEVYSLQTARAPLDQITRVSAELNNCTPAYFLILREAVGDRNEDLEFRARLVSALAGALTIPVLMGVAWQWRRSSGVALTAGLLLAVNPLHLWYSQETRAYALMLFFGLLSVLFYELALRRRRAGWWVGYFLTALLAIALHKTAIIFPIVCLLWQAWPLVSRREWRPGVLVHLAILIIAVVVLSPKSHPPAAEYGRRSSGLEIVYTLVTYAGGYSFGPSLLEIQRSGPMEAAKANWNELLIAGAALSLIGLALLRDFRASVSSKPAALFLLDLAIVSGYSAVSSFPYNIRYTIPALAGFVALTAGLACRARYSWLGRLALAGAVVVSLWADCQWFYSAAYRKEDARAAAQWLIAHEAGISSWTMLPNYSAEPLLFYLQCLGHPEMASRLVRAKENESTTFPPAPDALIIGRRDRIVDPDKLIAAYQAAAGNPGKPESFSGLDIYSRKPIP